MTGGYTILDLGGNVFTAGATPGAAKGIKVEGIYKKIKGNNPNKPFLLKNYSFSEGAQDKKRARFVYFEYMGGPFEARIDVNLSTWTTCRLYVESDDTVKFISVS